MTKKDLLENIRDYSPMEIAVAIKCGEVSLYELKKYTHGRFTPMLQQEVMNLLDNLEKGEKMSTPDTSRQSAKSDGSVIKPSSAMPPFSDNMVTCPECGQRVSKQALECSSCGFPFVAVRPTGTINPPLNFFQPTHGNGVNAHLGVPPNINSFSWGALALGWIWGVFNGNYWSLVLLPINIVIASMFLFWTIVPLLFVSLFCLGVGLTLQIVLGITGNRTAWNTKQYKSVEHFVRVQRGWNIAGFILLGLIVLLVLWVLLALLI